MLGVSHVTLATTGITYSTGHTNHMLHEGKRQSYACLIGSPVNPGFGMAWCGFALSTLQSGICGLLQQHCSDVPLALTSYKLRVSVLVCMQQGLHFKTVTLSDFVHDSTSWACRWSVNAVLEQQDKLQDLHA